MNNPKRCPRFGGTQTIRTRHMKMCDDLSDTEEHRFIEAVFNGTLPKTTNEKCREILERIAFKKNGGYNLVFWNEENFSHESYYITHEKFAEMIDSLHARLCEKGEGR